MCPYSSMDCQLDGRGIPIAVGSTQCIWHTGRRTQENGSSYLGCTTMPQGLDPEDLFLVILKSELRGIGLSLVGPADPPLHFVLDSIERLDLDQRIVFPALDPSVQS